MGLKEDYQEKIETQLKEWTAKINELTGKAGQATADVKAKMLKEIEELRGRNDELQQKLNEIKSAGTEKWEMSRPAPKKGWKT
jgi:uncharacterized coiled-coil DUF342 family protein